MHERLTDFREILRYVPRFRDRVFVIAIDGAVVEDDNFPNLLLDIALLAEPEHPRRPGPRGRPPDPAVRRADAGRRRRTSTAPASPTATTLQVALTAANRVTHEILEGLSANDLRAACPNALVAHPAGILGGVDHQFTGRVERVDIGAAADAARARHRPGRAAARVRRRGNSYRLNSDAVAVEVAKALRAVKLDLPDHRGRRPRAEGRRPPDDRPGGRGAS